MRRNRSSRRSSAQIRNTEEDAERGFQVAENADREIHQNAAEHRAKKRLREGLRVELALAKRFRRASQRGHSVAHGITAGKRSDRVAEERREQDFPRVAVVPLGHKPDFSREQSVTFIANAEERHREKHRAHVLVGAREVHAAADGDQDPRTYAAYRSF